VISAKIGFRNLARNRWRSGLTLGGIAVSVAFMVWILGFMEGWLGAMVQGATAVETGQVEVHRASFADNPRVYRSFAATAAMMETLAQVPGAEAVTPRVKLNGLVGNEEKSVVARVFGVDPRMEADWNHIRALYDGEIAFTDVAIGELLAGLEERGLRSNTLVVFLSDHGEEFFDHKGFEHGHTLFDEIIKVPLIFSLPGLIPENMRVGQQVRMLDVTPSALCQIENNQVHPSLPLLLDLSHTLGCSLDDFFGDRTKGRESLEGWLVHKKKDQTTAKAGKAGARAKVEIQPLLPGRGEVKRITPYLLRLAAGAEDGRPFFDHKGPEFGWLLSGVLKIAVEGEEIVLRKGDSIYLEDQSLDLWRNEGTGRAELIWVLC